MGNNKAKGSRYERSHAKIWRESLNFVKVQTSRAASKLIDDCGIDFVNIPFNVQAKTGYANNRPRYDQLYQYTMKKLDQYFDKNDPIFKKPFVLAYKLNGRKPENIQWTFAQKDIVPILKTYFNFQRNKFEINKLINQISDEKLKLKLIKFINE